MDYLQIFNKNSKLIQSIYSSRLKIQILLALAGGPKSLSDLRDTTGSTSQALIPKIRGLERLALIEPQANGYSHTTLGAIITKKIENFIITLGEAQQHRDFWANHDLTTLPPQFLDDIGQLIDSDIQFDTASDVLHVYSNFIRILDEADYILGISSMMSPEIANVIGTRVATGKSLELIVDQTIHRQLTMEPFLTQTKQLLASKNFRVWVVDAPLGIGVTVTNKHLSLGFNSRDGKVYDSTTDLYSTDPKALEWGHRLFNYFKQRAQLLQL
jgi:predicted transcriptional regulator